MTGIERRVDLRVACTDAFAEVFIGAASMGVFPLQDVSDSGVFIAAPAPTIPVSSEIRLRLMDSKPPLELKCIVVYVSKPGVKPSGYGIRFRDPPPNTVERVAETQARRTKEIPAVSVKPVDEQQHPVVLIVLANETLARSMATALTAFNVLSLALPPADLSLETLETHRGIKTALIDNAIVAARHRLSVGSIKKAVGARFLFFYSDALPDMEQRRLLQAAGVDQLWVAPLNPFEALEKIHTKCRSMR